MLEAAEFYFDTFAARANFAIYGLLTDVAMVYFAQVEFSQQIDQLAHDLLNLFLADAHRNAKLVIFQTFAFWMLRHHV